MVSGCGRYIIVYNGEIYNAPSLRQRLEALGHTFRSRSDTEVILEGYAHWGTDLIGKLNGIFAFAIWDSEERKLFAARDRIGIKPFYWTARTGVFAFASDARALRLLGFGKSWDPDSLALYLSLGYVPAPHSIWAGIAKLDAGQFLIWKMDREPQTTQYWSAPTGTDYQGTPGSLALLIDSVVEEQLLSDVPVGLFLSGGIDSSIIATSLAEMGRVNKDVKALTVGFPDRVDKDEFPVARETAKRLGLQLMVLQMAGDAETDYKAAVATLDEPLAYSAIVTQTKISELASQAGLKVVLSGDGGDELFGGYRWYSEDIFSQPDLPKGLIDLFLPHKRRKFKQMRLDREWCGSSPEIAHVQSVFKGLRADQIAFLLDRDENEISELIIAALTRYKCPELPERRWRQRLDLYTFCQDSVLTKVDRAGMAYGIEVRPPLLDHRIVEWALSRPVNQANDSAPKNLLRNILQNRGLGYLLDQPKRGFSLQSGYKPNRRTMRSEITAAAPSICIARNWHQYVPRRTPHYGQRLATLHWLMLWNRSLTA